MRPTQETNLLHLKSKWGAFYQNQRKWSNRLFSSALQCLSHKNIQNILKHTKISLGIVNDLSLAHVCKAVMDQAWDCIFGRVRSVRLPLCTWRNRSPPRSHPLQYSNSVVKEGICSFNTEFLCIWYIQARNRMRYISIDSVVSYQLVFFFFLK